MGYTLRYIRVGLLLESSLARVESPETSSNPYLNLIDMFTKLVCPSTPPAMSTIVSFSTCTQVIFATYMALALAQLPPTCKKQGASPASDCIDFIDTFCNNVQNVTV